MLKSVSIGVWAGALLFATAVQAAQAAVVAKVNGTEIPRARLESSFEAYRQEPGGNGAAPGDLDQDRVLQRELLDILIEQELLWQDAEKNQLVASEQDVANTVARARGGFSSQEEYLGQLRVNGFTEESFAENVKQRLSVIRLIEEAIGPSVSVSDAEIHDFYLANPDRFKSPEQIHTRHILIKVAPESDTATRAEARKRIDAILAEARQEGADFAALAKQHSEGPSAPGGGDLGFQPKGRLVAPFENAAFALQPGEISAPVETAFGYHIIKLEDRREGGLVPEEQAREQIRAYLARNKTQQAVQAHAAALREKADIEILERLLAE